MLKQNEMNTEINGSNEEIVRPLGRVTARELSAEEIAGIAGGWTLGISNAGGWGDRDVLN